MEREFVLNEPEMLFLAGYLRRLTSSDPAVAVRLDAQGAVIGIACAFVDPFIAFIALPLAANCDEPITAVVAAGRLRDVIGDVRKRTGATAIRLPDEVDIPAALLNLPPKDGWQPAFRAVAGDLSAKVDEQISAAQARAELLPRALQPAVLREAWHQPDWSSLPRGVLHIARELGFLNLAQAPVAASTNGPWKRLMTPMGQVFARADDGIARLSVVRSR